MLAQKFAEPVSLLNPQDHWPEFLTLALENPATSRSPFVDALDQTVRHIALSAGNQALGIKSSRYDLARVRAILTDLGFSCKTLTEVEVRELFLKQPDLFSRRFKADALIELAEIYVGAVSLIRGHTFNAERLQLSGQLTRLRLGSVNDRTEFITLISNASVMTFSSDRLQEFEATARMFYPGRYTLLIKFNEDRRGVARRRLPWRV